MPLNNIEQETRKEFQEFADSILWSNDDGSEKYIAVGNMADWWIDKLSKAYEEGKREMLKELEDKNGCLACNGIERPMTEGELALKHDPFVFFSKCIYGNDDCKICKRVTILTKGNYINKQMSEEENNAKEMTAVTWILIGLLILAAVLFGGMVLGLLFIFYMIR